MEATSPRTIQTLYRMLYDFDRVADEHGLSYWVDAGTLLGAQRHGGIIPWDDDCDVAILYADRDRLRRLRPAFAARGYEMSSWWGGYKLCVCGREFPFLDVMLYKPDTARSARLVPHTKAAREHWPKQFFLRRQVFPLRRLPFGEFDVAVPRDGAAFLRRFYGRDWDVVKTKTWDHEHEEEVVDAPKTDLSTRDRLPAQPTALRRAFPKCKTSSPSVGHM